MENNHPNSFVPIEENLALIEKDCWVRLVAGAEKSRNPFHTPSVATYAKDGLSLRTVVLRRALPETRELRFHTDIRSPKWNELKSNSSISALFYDASARIQLSIKGEATLHRNHVITEEAWLKTNLSSRRCYLTPHDPSSFSDFPTSGLSEDLEQGNFDLPESESGYSNFGIVSIQVKSIDWLWLNHAGHRRAYFDYQNDDFHWLIP